jgi:hypothetical protein
VIDFENRIELNQAASEKPQQKFLTGARAHKRYNNTSRTKPTPLRSPTPLRVRRFSYFS